jgi:succinate dehydrogenase / fumarate reductase flavoprotein subunit
MVVDVLVIGGGGAGLSSAVGAKEQGFSVVLASKKSPTSSQSVMAQGGINAPLGNLESDDVSLHIADTLKASYKLADRVMVEKLISNAVESIEYLEQIGVPFSRLPDASSPLKSIAQRKLGGASSKRACYAQDYTGLKILHTLYDRALKLGVDIRESLFLLDLIKSKSRIIGATFWDIKEGKLKDIFAKNVILATGGFGNLYYGYTTNANGATGDGVASAYRAGARLSNMEFVQFHPTALKGSSILISESARGEGGYLINDLGERFVDELAPRDVVVKAMFEQRKMGREIFLDIRHLGQKAEELMPQELHLCRLYAGVEPLNEPIPITPALHYTIGGVDVDRDLRVNSLDGLFSVGEVSCSHIHGANRLGGNSLLEIVAFGRLVAKQLKLEDFEIEVEDDSPETKSSIEKLFESEGKGEMVFKLKKELAKLMFDHFGVVREQSSMELGLEKISELEERANQIVLKDKSREFNQELLSIFEFKNSLTLAKALAKSALWREESRGVHLRSDFKEQKEEFDVASIYFADEVKRREF